MLSRQQIDTARRNIRTLLSALEHPIERELNENNKWGLVVNHGVHKALIYHQGNKEFIVVQFRIDFDADAIERFSQIKANQTDWLKFLYGLKSVISSPITGYATFFNESQNLTAFSVNKNIFPFRDGFNLKELDEAIQAVISVGVNGINFISGVVGARTIQQEVSEVPAPPEGMYS